MESKPLAQHLWLKALVGNWKFESRCNMGPGQPEMVSGGTESVRALGDYWVIGESRGTMPDGNEMTAVMTLGFDPAKGKFVGTWVGSPMPSMFVYEGVLEQGGTVLPLCCRGPSCMDATKTVDYQDVVTLRGSGASVERLLTSRMHEGDGKWVEFMKARYWRV